MRLTLAVIVFCSTLSAAPGQLRHGSVAAPESSEAATIAAAVRACTPSDDDGEWRPQPDAAASLTESAWKWRALHAGIATTSHPVAAVGRIPTDRAPARATAAPSYLLHGPLLI